MEGGENRGGVATGPFFGPKTGKARDGGRGGARGEEGEGERGDHPTGRRLSGRERREEKKEGGGEEEGGGGLLQLAAAWYGYAERRVFLEAPTDGTAKHLRYPQPPARGAVGRKQNRLIHRGGSDPGCQGPVQCCAENHLNNPIRSFSGAMLMRLVPALFSAYDGDNQMA